MTDQPDNRKQTAAELMAELERDPRYVARRRRQEQQRQEAIAAYAVAAQPVLQELQDAGYSVASIGELRTRFKNGMAPYRDVVPVLCRWLPRVTNLDVKEDIVRTLSVPWAKPDAVYVLLNEFEQLADRPNAGLGWAIANAIEVIADESVFREIERLVLNPRYGEARQMLVLAMGNMATPSAGAVLEKLLDDDEVAGHAAMALGRLRTPAARERLKALSSEHPADWVRKEAKKALKRIGRGQ